MRRSKLGLATGLGLGVLGYAALVGLARRTLVSDPPPAQLEAALQGWLAEVRLPAIHRYVHTPVGRVHVLLAGQGHRAVLVLPGLGSSAGEFARLLAQLGRHYRVAAIDLPGSGLSEPVSFAGHPGQAWNAVLTAVADELGLPQFTLVGHSLGGLAAGGYAIAQPERVRQLVLISPLGFGRRFPLLWNFAMVPGLMDFRGLYDRSLLILGSRRRPGQQGGADDGDPQTAWDRYRLLVGLRFGRGSDLGLIGRLLQPLRLRSDSQLLPALGLLSGRTLVLWGGRDRRIAVGDAERELRYFKGLRLEVVPGAGHLLPIVEPNLTARLVTEFLGESSS
ncbi:MAG: alpha/beta hydrolase [Candidatus Dormiibacterota bacterium]